MYNNNYTNQGITIVPNIISEGDKVTLVYQGLLAKSGADAVYAHIGFGDGSNWQSPTYVKMGRTSNGFETTITINKMNNLHIAFKDSANNWDNNSGSNYVFNVQSR